MCTNTKGILDMDKAKFLKSLYQNLGLVNVACKELNISKEILENEISLDADFKNKVEQVKEYVLDFVEGKLLENIANNDTRSIIYFLDAKGKKRGYGEQEKTEGTQLKLFEVEVL